jgi:hypothetical protein
MGLVSVTGAFGKPTPRNGVRFDYRYCRVVFFRDGVMIRVRAWLDGAVVARLFEEHPLS